MYQVKKRLLIICSIIGVLLAGFQFPIYAETTPPDYSSSTSIMSSTPLDQYFYDNYDLLPYIESNGDQYINTGIISSNNYRTSISFSDINNSDYWQCLFGSTIENPTSNRYYLEVLKNEDSIRFGIGSGTYNTDYSINKYNIYNAIYDKNKVFINNSLIYESDSSPFTGNNIIIFARNGSSSYIAYSKYKLYRFSIYNYAANDGEGALVRDYYPARAKSSGVIGLYDAVNKTFVTTSGSVPFASPDGDPVNLSLGANITQFLSGSLSWIGAIFDGINEMPIIWVFIAIALAGVAFRWARRIVHF